MTNRALMFVFFALIFPVLFFAILGNSLLHPVMVWNDTITALLYFLLIIGVSKRLSDLIIDPSGSFNVLRIPFNLFQYIFFILVPANIYFNNIVYEHITLSFDDVSYRNAYILVFVGYVSYLIGERLAKSRASYLTNAAPPLQLTRFSRMPVLAIGLCGLSVLVFMIAIGDPAFLFADRNELEIRALEADAQSIALLVDALVRVPAFCAFYISFYLYVSGFWKRTGPFSLLMLLITAGTFFLFNYPASVPRLWLGGTAISLLIVYLQKKLVPANFRLTAFVIFAVMIVFPMAHVLRFISSQSVDGHIFELVASAFSDSQFDSFQMVMILQSYVDDRAHTYGWQTLSALLFFVPRAIFPSKGKSIGSVVGEDLGFTFTNISSPLLVEIYFDFAYFGVIALFVLFGYVSRRVEARWNNGGYGLAGSLIVSYLAGWQFILYRGSMFTALNYLLPVLLLLLATTLLVRRQTHWPPTNSDPYTGQVYGNARPRQVGSPRR